MLPILRVPPALSKVLRIRIGSPWRLPKLPSLVVVASPVQPERQHSGYLVPLSKTDAGTHRYRQRPYCYGPVMTAPLAGCVCHEPYARLLATFGSPIIMFSQFQLLM